MSTIRAKQIQIFFVVIAYWAVSISLVFVNKYILSSSKLETPVFVTMFQCLVTVALSFISVPATKGLGFPISVYKPSFKLHLQILDLAVVYVGMILFNNFTLKMIPVSFYNIARALTTAFNLVFTRLFLKKPVSLRATFCCFIVILGFLMGLSDTKKDSITLVPIILGVLSSMFVSLFAIYTQWSLGFVDRNTWLLQNITNINAIFLMIPLLPLTGEISFLINQFDLITAWDSIIFLFVSGILGFMIGICTNLQIKYTSALTHNISGTAKSCLQTILAVMYHREWNHSFFWWVGTMMVLVGSSGYSYVRNQEMVRAHKDEPFKE